MVRRLIRAIGQAIGRRNRTFATAPGMRRGYTRTAASVPIASARNAGRSMIPTCMPIVSRVLASKGPRRWRAAANGVTAGLLLSVIGAGRSGDRPARQAILSRKIVTLAPPDAFRPLARRGAARRDGQIMLIYH